MTIVPFLFIYMFRQNSGSIYTNLFSCCGVGEISDFTMYFYMGFSNNQIFFSLLGCQGPFFTYKNNHTSCGNCLEERAFLSFAGRRAN